jgi:tryptophanyl-tRNA synthetase
MRVFSGIRASGDKTLGNYSGGFRQYVATQEQTAGEGGEAFFCVVDLHSITTPFEPEALRESTLAVGALLFATGLDPARSTVFIQSHVPAHAEAAWLLGAVASYGELRRMTQVKEKSEGQDFVSAGLFQYPVLMAGDILLYQTDVVPIGDDQRQHLELARNIAERFNNRYGETFRIPEPVIAEVGARIMDLQEPTNKMSTSAGSEKGTVFLLDPPDAIAKKIRSAVTDTGNEVRCAPDKPGVTNLIHILSAVSGQSIESIEREYGDGGYGRFKQAVADAVVELIEPIQQRYVELRQDTAQLDAMLARGADRANELASETVGRVRELMGCLPRSG